MSEEIRILEEALLNSIPALQTVLVDGWVLRLNRNYTYRANCVCPLRYVEADGVGDQIRSCEEIFYRNRIPPVFKVTPLLQEGLAERLLAMGYGKIKTVKVMRLPLSGLDVHTDARLTCSDSPDDAWRSASAELTGVTDLAMRKVHDAGLRSIAVQSVFVKASVSGKTVGCGYGTLERGYVGIYDLHVAAPYRWQGIGTAICQSVFRFGTEHRADYAYLIVHGKNENAISLYSRMGFSTVYEYGFYERADSEYRIKDA